jgi:hypothetical protein
MDGLYGDSDFIALTSLNWLRPLRESNPVHFEESENTRIERIQVVKLRHGNQNPTASSPRDARPHSESKLVRLFLLINENLPILLPCREHHVVVDSILLRMSLQRSDLPVAVRDFVI